MSSVGRIDQAIVLLRERLKTLNSAGGRSSAAQSGIVGTSAGDALMPLRELVCQGRIGQEDLRKAFVRTLLADALGSDVTASLEFQSIADEVARMLENNEAGQNLITRALAELG